MKDLVKDLLIVSRIESARLFLKKEEFSLEELTREIVKEFEPFARASNCEIEFFAEQNLPKIFGDRYQIRQVIENLLDNAIRYTKGKGKVKIRIKSEKNFVHFEIEDNGVGIPKEDQKFIFQKFFRASNVLKYKTQGTGLGLYISKAIIERSGGKIGFKSQEGVGSTFWFKLPIK
jgi:signal transduction histidine kinase